MSEQRRNPSEDGRSGQGPGGGGRPLDEGQLLDWIEGRVSDAEGAAMEAASGRPGLSARVAQMRSHRRVLRECGVERAPGDLVSRVVQSLEREQLIGEPELPARPPIQISDHVRVGGRAGGWSRRLPGLAMAAGLLLLLGGGVYLSMVMVGPGGDGKRNERGPVAMNDASEGLAGAGRERPRAAAMKASERDATAAELAAGPVVGDAASNVAPGPVALAARGDVGGEVGGDTPGEVAGAMMGEMAGEITPDRAAALAQEGRLVMRVLARDTRGLASIEQAGASRSPSQAWRLRKDVPTAVAAAVMPTGPRAAVDPDAPSGPLLALDESRRRAAATLLTPLVGPRAAFSMQTPAPGDPLARVRGTYLLEAPGAAGAIAAVRAHFAQRLQAGVLFEELPAALAVTVPTSPEQTLWWTQAPAQWTQRVVVPVVVEQR